MRLTAGVSVVCICIVSLVVLTPKVSAVDTSQNIWNSNIAITEEGDLTQSEVTSGTHCDSTLAKVRKLEGFVSQNIAGLPQFSQSDVEYVDVGTICATRNSSGLFAGQYYSPTQNPLDLLELQPGSDSGVTYRAAPQNNVVVQSARIGSNQSIGINYNFSAIGQLGVTKKAFLKYDFNWVVKNSAPQLRYTDTSNVYHNGFWFSGNGKYMVIRLGNTLTKVDLETQELTPFYYRASITDVVSAAISRDGRYVATNMHGQMYIHDTLGCTTSYGKAQWPKITQTVFAGCTKSTNHFSKLTQAVPAGYGTVRKLEFSQNDSSLTLAIGQEYRANSFYWKKLRVAALDYKSTEQGYLAMGDSFTSGEGDLQGGDWYEPGTDEQGNKDTFENRNLCHLSRRSYPYLLAKQLGYLDGNLSSPITPEDNGLFHSVACSGAVIHNVIGGSENGLIDYLANENDHNKADNQFGNFYQGDLGRWQPGRIKQLDTLEKAVFGGYSLPETKPEVITIGIGGNDAGFGDSIKACAMPGTCKRAVEGSDDASNIAIGIMRLKPKLIETYNSIQESSPQSRVYVHGYPVFVSDRVGETTDLIEGGTCRFNVRLDYKERRLVVEGVKYMNKVIQAAAKEAGVVYVDIEDILDGVNLCSGAELSDYAVNGVTAGNDVDFKLCIFRTGCLGKEMFHPNPKAHARYAERVLRNTQNFTKNMPEPSPATVPVPESFFGNKALYEAITINSGGNTSIVIPEPKPFLSTNNGNIKVLQGGLLPGSTLRIELQSTPKKIDEFIVPESGEVDQYIQLPDNAESGVHEVHLFGTTNIGLEVDYYEQIMLADGESDFDGDGVLNDQDGCPTLINSFIDEDQDGVDDACDGEVLALQTPEEDTALSNDGREKGQPNPETVAGNEPVQSTLGANTGSVAQDSGQNVLSAVTGLQNTGKSAVIFVIIGASTVLSALLIAKYWNQD
jgi:hypothetical protein